MTIRENIGRIIFWYESNGMIVDATGRGKFLGSGKNKLVSREDRLDVGMHKGCLNGLN
jgi:hypothetical protein